jgi:ADP-heptose:LPS heptosyltransferase
LHLGASDRFEPELEVNRVFLTWLGMDVADDDYWPALPAHPAHRAWAERAVRCTRGGTVLGICPSGTTTSEKNYPPRAYAAALEAVGVDPLHVVIFGDAAASGTCDAVEQAIRSTSVTASVKNLCGRTSLPMLVEGLRACDAVLSIDAGPLHISTALGRPTVGIVGGGFPHRFFPWGNPERTRIAEHPLECFGCGYRCPYETRRCVVDLPPEEVARQLRDVLRESPAANRTGS